MKEDVKKELEEIRREIEAKEGIYESELVYLADHRAEILEMQEITLAEWAGIPEEEFNRNCRKN